MDFPRIWSHTAAASLLSAASHAMHVSASALRDAHRRRDLSNSSPAADGPCVLGRTEGRGRGRAEGSRGPTAKFEGKAFEGEAKHAW